MTLYRRIPRQIGTPLERLTRDWEPDSVLAEVQRIWEGVVGEAIAQEARPVGERTGVVTVACSASVWAQELDLMAPDIVESLNRGLRRGRVRRLRCTSAH